MKSIKFFVPLLLVIFFLSGCVITTQFTVKCGSNGKCSAQGSVTAKGKTNGAIARGAASTALLIDPNSVYIDLAGTNYQLQSSGIVALTLKDASGSDLAMQSFPWVMVGTKAVFQNPAAVQAWAAGYPSAQSISLSIAPGQAPQDGAMHTFAAALYASGTLLGSGTTTFISPCSPKPSPYRCLGQ